MPQPYKPLDTSWQASVIIDLSHHQLWFTLILYPVADAVKRNYVYRQGAIDAGFPNGDTELRRRNVEVLGDTTNKHIVMLLVIGLLSLAKPYPTCVVCAQDNVFLLFLAV
ncbi:LOW QUALITY PROTEIN: hypothetical protein T265_15788 [Opisthorchis viverrini]|uniref:Uncharacterized protein n=1 Tax=Opisthorchis viverrini TaxID=6198 RepID=A0A074YVZ9_OPIVI|nr:LOW QUALITY PROTEIN: hypothetical protein T265_15788 [Opisthorchis viverrini]KER18853.1 LOW QUALITY PROTEIN: hypothetical protein T265_15788 [Opisthorchis viverrini]